MIRHDLHTHTTYSDGGHAIDLQVLIARAMELDAIAFTDHHPVGDTGLAVADTFRAYLEEIESARDGLDDLIVLKGAEAAALDSKGTMSIPEGRARELEWVLCDLGGHSEGTLKNTPADKMTYAENVVRTYLALCDIPYLHGIAHPFNTGNTDPALLPEDYPEAMLVELADKMGATDKVFDVMNLQVFWFQHAGISPADLTAQYADVVKLFSSRGVTFQVSSDDHRCGIGHTTWSQKVLRMAGVPPERIVDPRAIPLCCGVRRQSSA